MAGLKEIRRRIASVTNTKQITRAMKLVSAAKLRRSQELAESGRAYVEELGRVLRKVSIDLPPSFKHPLFTETDEVKVRRIVVIAGERGLCGAFNANVFKAVQAGLEEAEARYEFVTIGRRAQAAAKRFGWQVVESYEGWDDRPQNWPIKSIFEHLMRDVRKNACQEVILYYTRFVTAMSCRVTNEKFLPVSLENLCAAEEGAGFERGSDEEGPRRLILPGHYRYGPKPELVANYLIPVLLRAKLFQACLEARASEHGSRMTAMDAATSNAEELIEKLRLYYNRARQSTITRELIDIVGGAEALS